MFGMVKLLDECWEIGKAEGEESRIAKEAAIAAGGEVEFTGFDMFLETFCFLLYVIVCIASCGLFFWLCREINYQHYVYRRNRYNSEL